LLGAVVHDSLPQILGYINYEATTPSVQSDGYIFYESMRLKKLKEKVLAFCAKFCVSYTTFGMTNKDFCWIAFPRKILRVFADRGKIKMPGLIAIFAAECFCPSDSI